MAAPIRKSAKPKPIKVGAYKGSGPHRKRWNGTKWVASPVSLVGGNMGRGNKNRVIKPAVKVPDHIGMTKGKNYGKPEPSKYKGPGGNPNGSGQGQAQQAPPAPKLPPKPTPPKAKAPKKAAPPKATAPKPTEKAKSSADRMRAWALANKKMIEKSGTKTQKAILAKALKPKKKKEEMKISAARKAGYQGSRLY